MGMKKKRQIGKIAGVLLLTVIALLFIYPVFLMFMNAFKPFGEIGRAHV